MPYMGKDFPDQDTGETRNFTIGFGDDLGPRETILSASWFCTVVSGTDPAAQARVSAVAADNVINESDVTQKLLPGLTGVKYLILAQVTTSAGQTLSNWSHCTVKLPA